MGIDTPRYVLCLRTRPSGTSIGELEVHNEKKPILCVNRVKMQIALDPGHPLQGVPRTEARKSSRMGEDLVGCAVWTQEQTSSCDNFEILDPLT